MDPQNQNTFGNSGEQPIYTPSPEERTIAILSHLLTFLTSVFVAGFVPPLIIYLWKKEDSKYIAEHAKESLNFQLTLLICYFVAGLATLILIGFVLLGIVALIQLILVIIAALKASDNVIYRYPLSIKFVK